METHTDNTLQATSNQLAAIQLSPHFTLGEMLTLDRHPDNLPSLQAVVSLAYGCQLILEPVRQEVGPIIINSGFRTPEVNHQVGGVKLGQAADLRPQDPRQFDRLVALLRRHALTDQLLTGRGWLHLSWKPFGVPRHYVAIDYYG